MSDPGQPTSNDQPARVDPYAAPLPPPQYGAPGLSSTYQSAYFAAPKPPQGLAVASMVTGIIGVCFSLLYGSGFLPSLAAVITGHLARKRQPYARGLWLTGLICGYIGLGIAVLWFAALIIFAVFAISTSGTFTSGNLGNNT